MIKPLSSLLLGLAGLAALSVFVNWTSLDSHVEQEQSARVTADQALEMLLRGNARFVAGQMKHPHSDARRRQGLRGEQHPVAAVLGCSDSRVPPELLFDEGLGDLFIIRVAGNVVDDGVAGSIEYAVDELGVPLVLVLGHEGCGAVTAALHAHHDAPAEIESVLRLIRPALEHGMHLAEAVDANVQLSVERLQQTPDLARSVASGRVRIVGATYELSTGRVALLPPQQRDGASHQSRAMR